jgi:catechol 2,3-dioxygenase-like lactoylglutathione lyase family enzyme
MYYGWPSLCLNVRDLEASTRFYEALGMEVLEDVSAAGKRVVLRSGPFRLGLFVGIDTNTLNFRGADVVALHETLKRQCPGLEGAPQRYSPGDGRAAELPGWSWFTRDPDGNRILFDTNRSEEGEPFRRRRLGQLLRDAEHELTTIGASAELLETFRTQLIDRFCED